MTHAAKGQYDTNRLEFHRIKMSHWRWHALRVLSFPRRLSLWVGNGAQCQGGPQLGYLFTEPGLAVERGDCTADWRGVTRGTSEVAALGRGINTSSASLRTEAHRTRKTLRRHVVFWAEEQRREDLTFHYFGNYCTSTWKSKVHLRVTHTLARAHTLTPPTIIRKSEVIFKSESQWCMACSAGISPRCGGQVWRVFPSDTYIIWESRQHQEFFF